MVWFYGLSGSELVCEDKVENINVTEKFIEPVISLSGNSSNAAHMLGRVKTNWCQQHSDKSDKAKGISIESRCISSGCISTYMKSHLDLLSIVLHFLHTAHKATFKNPILHQKPMFLNMVLYNPDHRPVCQVKIFPKHCNELNRNCFGCWHGDQNWEILTRRESTWPF